MPDPVLPQVVRQHGTTTLAPFTDPRPRPPKRHNTVQMPSACLLDSKTIPV